MINKHRLGYYQVGLKRFNNKALALMEHDRSGYALEWIFNDDVYGKFDWTKPIDVPLFELYRLRAQQLRDTYDYICLHYSGGADSNNALHSFIDNGIFVDEIVMYQTKPDVKFLTRGNTDNRYLFSEIEFEAKDHLKMYRNRIHPDTKIREFDIAEPFINLMNNDNWFETLKTSKFTTLLDSARQLAVFKDFEILADNLGGKNIAYLIGNDKPLVWYDEKDYYCFFSDANAYHVPPIEHNSKILNGNCFTEFFYWTPDVPEIVIKQSQLVKAAAELNPNIKESLKYIKNKPIGDYRKILHPIIYPPHTEPNFQAEKLNELKRLKDKK